MEHITTSDAVDFVLAHENTAATITAHHLLYNRNHIFSGNKIHPHMFCLPILKREEHRERLVQAATSGNPKFFLGTDSAPHAITAKECECGCAGIFTAHAALPLYAEVFERSGAIHLLDAFASQYGADFYGIPRNKGSMRLAREPWTVPETYEFGEGLVRPLRAGEVVSWRVVSRQNGDGEEEGV
jgi:dihydroorotase